MNVPLLDLRAQFKAIREEILAATMEVYESQRFILGPKVEELEKQIAAYVHAQFAVGVSSGTDALLISLMSADIGPGDLVITSPYTFFSTAGSIARLGAAPVFVDIDQRTYNIDPERLKEKISSMSKEERRRISKTMVQGLLARIEGAMMSGDFDARVDRHLSWVAMRLDEQGWSEMSTTLAAAFGEVEQIRSDAESRLAGSGDTGIPSTCGIVGFRSPVDSLLTPPPVAD